MHVLLQADIGKPQTASCFLNFSINQVKILIRQRILNGTNILQQLLKLLWRDVSHLGVHIVHFLFHIEQVLECTL
ncbi:hypothetical protein D3C80_1816850 [compost metagenome]